MTTMIDEHIKPQIISIDRVTGAPNKTSTTWHLLQKKSQQEVILPQKSSQKDIPQDQEFAVHKIVWQLGTGPQTK